MKVLSPAKINLFLKRVLMKEGCIELSPCGCSGPL